MGGEDLCAMPVNWMSTACMMPGFKRRSGWLGLALCPGDPNSWTCRLEGRDGVYGLSPAYCETSEKCASCVLTVYFFPDSCAELLESYSLAAAVIAAAKDYPDWIRDFPRVSEKTAPFAVAELRLTMDRATRELFMCIEADERRQVLSADGVKVPGGQGWLIEPLGVDEDLPCLDIAADLARSLVAGLSACLGREPGLSVAASPANLAMYHADGGSELTPSIDGKRHVHVFSWGETEKAAVLFPGAEEPLAEDPAVTREWKERYFPVRRQEPEEGRNDRGELPRLVILSGFLGSGKTTFLNQFIEFYTNRGQFVTVIQNEIGEVGVDGKLLEGDDSVIELDEGCVCCTLSGGLSSGVRRLVERFRPEVIVLESTGLANPFNLVRELEDLSHMVRLECVVTLADASNFHRNLEAGEVALEQIRAADVIVLNKCDLAGQEALAEIRRSIERLNVRARVLETTHGRINPGLLTSGPRRKSELFEEFTHFRDHTSHGKEGFSHWRLDLPPRVDLNQLRSILDQSPQNIYRIKGIVDTGGQDGLSALQYVQGRYEFVPLEKDYDGGPFLICIGRDLDPDALTKMWRPLSGEQSVWT